MHYDVFNGDADGILSLVQLRLAEPKESILISGVKRDISLLKQVPVDKAVSVTVLDISMEKNIDALNQLLQSEVDVLYIDHHRPGDIPSNNLLEAVIDTDANTCTALLVNQRLDNQFVNWAIAAAYGDNMLASAQALAAQHGLNEEGKSLLKAFGTYVNYNGYGSIVDDLHFSPVELFEQLVKFENPLDLIKTPDSVFHKLEAAYHEDMQKAEHAAVLEDNDVIKVVELDDASWARRVSGVFGNELANRSPDKAHAVVTTNVNGNYTVSLRAPLSNKTGAGDICAQFATGGGRAAAAGINELPKDRLSEFILAVEKAYA